MFKLKLFICELASLEFITDFLRMISIFSEVNFKCGKTKRNTYYTPITLCERTFLTPLPTHTHILRNAHILLLLCLSQVWNSLEKYDKWNSHTLGSFHILWHCLSQGSVPVCLPAGLLMVWGCLERWNLNYFQSGPFSHSSYYCSGQETARRPFVSLAQASRVVCVNNNSLLHWKRFCIYIFKMKDVFCFPMNYYISAFSHHNCKITLNYSIFQPSLVPTFTILATPSGNNYKDVLD